MYLIMKAQAYPFTGKGQQTQSIWVTDTKSTSNNKVVSKNLSILPFAILFLAICLFFLLKRKKKIQNEVNFKHRFTYTYMLVEDFYHLLLYFLRVLDDNIYLFKCQEMEIYLSSCSSWHGPSTLLMVYITLKKLALFLPVSWINIAWYCDAVLSQVNKKALENKLSAWDPMPRTQHVWILNWQII